MASRWKIQSFPLPVRDFMIDRNPLSPSSHVESLCENQERSLPIFCPQCSTRIQVTKGLCGNRLIDAIMLQAQRIGAELHCQQCNHTFVYHQVQTIGQATQFGETCTSEKFQNVNF